MFINSKSSYRLSMHPPNFPLYELLFYLKIKMLKEIFFLKNKVSEKVIIRNPSRIPKTLKSI